ncbi:FkbM family methyltransferase [Alteromonas lipolytica]|nr:FkbM family methyltransferase [Alteromonas lipolytica]GGF52412.1 hypothetical protein GCM10011338_00660 [Alteromonas lipolytica]
MSLFTDLFAMLAESPQLHGHQTPFYSFTNHVCAEYVARSGFAEETSMPVELGPFGQLILPYYSMGNIDSLKLFGLDELILFAFYLKHQKRYYKVADMGANIGLHSILMAKLGWQVTAFEPDPVHVKKITEHMQLNDVDTITIRENAVAGQHSLLTFTRLLGNRTGSHIKGKKSEVYGGTEEFDVTCLAFADLITAFDFVKMDIEGAEADAICSTSTAHWQHTDVMLEVGGETNAERIFIHARELGLSMFSQKTGWQKVTALADMPTSHREGSLFISSQHDTVW